MKVKIRTCELTKSILQQMPTMTYYQMREVANVQRAAKKSANEKPAMEFIGWVHGSVLDPKDDYTTWLIARIGEGDYARWESHPEARKKYPQIYVV